MNSLDAQMEDLITQLNKAESKNKILTAELHHWKSTARYTRKINKRLASEFIKDMPADDVDLIWLERDQVMCLSELEQAGGISQIRYDAYIDLSNKECPASGYIITSEVSRNQIVKWAEFEKECNNEEGS